MNVRVTIELPAEKLSELQALLIGKVPSVPVPEEPAVAVTPTNGKPTAEPEPVPEKHTEDNDKSSDKPSKITKEMIRAKGIEITKAGKQDQLAAVFKQFGAANLRSINEDDYEAVYQMLEAI